MFLNEIKAKSQGVQPIPPYLMLIPHRARPQGFATAQGFFYLFYFVFSSLDSSGILLSNVIPSSIEGLVQGLKNHSRPGPPSSLQGVGSGLSWVGMMSGTWLRLLGTYLFVFQNAQRTMVKPSIRLPPVEYHPCRFELPEKLLNKMVTYSEYASQESCTEGSHPNIIPDTYSRTLPTSAIILPTPVNNQHLSLPIRKSPAHMRPPPFPIQQDTSLGGAVCAAMASLTHLPFCFDLT